MKAVGWIFLCAMAAWPQVAFAQHGGGAATPLTDNQKTGRMLYEQSCGICHVKPHLMAPVFGPVLSQESLEGKEELIRAYIANGSARMPGFKTMYKPEQIAAIASYIKTLPKPAAETVDTNSAPRAQD
jgi:mono/diheme cytochrome c family protein